VKPLGLFILAVGIVILTSCGSDQQVVESPSPTPTVISKPDSSPSPSPTPTPTPVPTPIPGALPMNAPKGYEWVLGIWEGDFKWGWDGDGRDITTTQIIVGWEDNKPIIIVRSAGIFYFNPYKDPMVGALTYKREDCSNLDPVLVREKFKKEFPSWTEEEISRSVEGYITWNRLAIRGTLVVPWDTDVDIPEDYKPVRYLTIVRYQLEDDHLVIVAAPAIPKWEDRADDLAEQVTLGWEGKIPTAEMVGMDGEYIWVPAFSVVIDLRPDYSGVYRLPSYEAEPLSMVAPPKFPDGVTWVGQAHLKKVSDVPTYVFSCN